jgi:microcystin-dependent protein
MANPYLGEIRLFAGNFAPKGWATCDGQLIPISQNTALFSLLGTNFGGNGTSNFALPNFQDSAPMHYDQGSGLSPHYLGEAGGALSVALSTSQSPAHTHAAQAFTGRGANANAAGPQVALADSQGNQVYAPSGSAAANFDPSALGAQGGGQPHNNVMPSLGITFIIALQGVYPPRS